MVATERTNGPRAPKVLRRALGVGWLVVVASCSASPAESGPPPTPQATVDRATTVRSSTDAVTTDAATTDVATTVVATTVVATTVVATTVVATTVVATTDVPTTAEPATSDAPTTQAPTTEAAPTTTMAPTTTAPPPPTTVAATTTTAAPAPLNRVPVAPVDVALVAVGEQGGPETARIQQRLLDLGFWLSGADGEYGGTTRQAVMAFQKYLGLNATGAVDEGTAAFLTGMAMRAYGHADSGTLVEIDKTRQLLMFVVDGRTQWVFNTSTGNGETYIEEDQNSPGTLVEGVSLTPDGFHKVNRERAEGWWEGDLGQIYRPKYFVGGVAVHGSSSVPNYPASHGCVRVTVEAMDYIWETGLMPIRVPVWVHEKTPLI